MAYKFQRGNLMVERAALGGAAGAVRLAELGPGTARLQQCHCCEYPQEFRDRLEVWDAKIADDKHERGFADGWAPPAMNYVTPRVTGIESSSRPDRRRPVGPPH